LLISILLYLPMFLLISYLISKENLLPHFHDYNFVLFLFKFTICFWYPLFSKKSYFFLFLVKNNFSKYWYVLIGLLHYYIYIKKYIRNNINFLSRIGKFFLIKFSTFSNFICFFNFCTKNLDKFLYYNLKLVITLKIFFKLYYQLQKFFVIIIVCIKLYIKFFLYVPFFYKINKKFFYFNYKKKKKKKFSVFKKFNKGFLIQIM